jgi:hypothetical protein
MQASSDLRISPGRPVVIASAAQGIAVGIGWIWGFAQLNHGRSLPDFFVFYPRPMNSLAVVASLTLFAEWLLCLVSDNSRRSRLTAAWVSFALGIYTSLIIVYDPFLRYEDNFTFIMDVYIILPILVGMNFLVRARAWAGLGATMAFVAVSLAMIIHNACASGGVEGFLEATVD